MKLKPNSRGNKPGASTKGKRGRLGRRHKSGPSPMPVRDTTVAPSEMEAHRRRLTELFVETQWDLGGVVYEMASRDSIRVDVLRRQAAKLQAVDAELAEVERLLHLEKAGAGGVCTACGAFHARGAVFCWQCGRSLMQGAARPVPAGGAAPTVRPQEQVAAAVARVAPAFQVPTASVAGGASVQVDRIVTANGNGNGSGPLGGTGTPAATPEGGQ